MATRKRTASERLNPPLTPKNRPWKRLVNEIERLHEYLDQPDQKRS